MRDVEFFNWYLPNNKPRGKPYLSRWKMTREEAAQRYGNIEPALHTREVRQIPETEEEQRLAGLRFVDQPR